MAIETIKKDYDNLEELARLGIEAELEEINREQPLAAPVVTEEVDHEIIGDSLGIYLREIGRAALLTPPRKLNWRRPLSAHARLRMNSTRRVFGPLNGDACCWTSTPDAMRAISLLSTTCVSSSPSPGATSATGCLFRTLSKKEILG